MAKDVSITPLASPLDSNWRYEMRPRIDATQFGSITVDGAVFDHDVVISPHDEVSKRKKKLSKAVYGTSHAILLQGPSTSTGRQPGQTA
jgi:hypothetical protein